MRAYLARNVLGWIAVGEDGQVIGKEPFPREPGAVAEILGREAGLEGLRDYEVVTEEEGPNPAGEMLRRGPWGPWGVEEAEYHRLVKAVAVMMARARLEEAAQERDRELIQALQALRDLEEGLNLLTERASEWQALCGPAEGLSRFVKGVGDLSSLRGELEGYVTRTMEEIAPNLAGLVGAILGAGLIAEAKGLEPLARMPGSRVQVLGARRAIFQHMRGREPSPKHGIIFQHPLIKGAPWWQRGKIARSLGAKAAIAARLDAFSGEYQAEGLREKLERRVEEVRRKYPSEPKRLRIIRRPKEERKKRWKKRR